MRKIFYSYFRFNLLVVTVLIFSTILTIFTTSLSVLEAKVSDVDADELTKCKALHENLVTAEVYAQLLILNAIYTTQRTVILMAINHLKVLQDLQDPSIFYRFRSKLLRILTAKIPPEHKEEMILNALADSEEEVKQETQAKFSKYRPYEPTKDTTTKETPLLSDFTRDQDPRPIEDLQANTIYRFEFLRQGFDNKGPQRVIISPAVIEFFQSNLATGPFLPQRWLRTFLMGYVPNIKTAKGLKKISGVYGWLKEHEYWEVKLLKSMWRILVYRNDRGIWILEKALHKKDLP